MARLAIDGVLVLQRVVNGLIWLLDHEPHHFGETFQPLVDVRHRFIPPEQGQFWNRTWTGASGGMRRLTAADYVTETRRTGRPAASCSRFRLGGAATGWLTAGGLTRPSLQSGGSLCAFGRFAQHTKRSFQVLGLGLHEP